MGQFDLQGVERMIWGMVHKMFYKVNPVMGFTKEDLFQEACMAAWRDHEKFCDSFGTKYSSFIYRTVSFRLQNVVKRSWSERFFPEAVYSIENDNEEYESILDGCCDEFLLPEQILGMKETVEALSEIDYLILSQIINTEKSYNGKRFIWGVPPKALAKRLQIDYKDLEKKLESIFLLVEQSIVLYDRDNLGDTMKSDEQKLWEVIADGMGVNYAKRVSLEELKYKIVRKWVFNRPDELTLTRNQKRAVRKEARNLGDQKHG